MNLTHDPTSELLELAINRFNFRVSPLMTLFEDFNIEESNSGIVGINFNMNQALCSEDQVN